MNAVYLDKNMVIAKTCHSRDDDRQKVVYAFSDDFHSVCMDKKDIVRAEIEACERLLKYATNESERAVVEKEIEELKNALDLMQ